MPFLSHTMIQMEEKVQVHICSRLGDWSKLLSSETVSLRRQKQNLDHAQALLLAVECREIDGPQSYQTRLGTFSTSNKS